MTTPRSSDEIRNSVRSAYAAVAESADSCCGPNPGSTAAEVAASTANVGDDYFFLSFFRVPT